MKKQEFLSPRFFRGALSVAVLASATLCAAQNTNSERRPTTAPVVATIANFGSPNGSDPGYENLVQGSDGNLYGTTSYGGTSDDGTVFKVTTSGTITTLHSFTGSDGSEPTAGLLLGTDGNLYGTTVKGGTSSVGTVFKITPLGKLTTLHSFDEFDGYSPKGALMEGTNGEFYGTTAGSYVVGGYWGTVFKITSSGTFTTLFYFSDDYGAYPEAGLVQGTNGNLYGTTSGGGTGQFSDGVVFEATTAGTVTSVYSFSGTNGSEPTSQLVQASDGSFYGTAFGGGAAGDGEVFKIDSSLLSLTVLYSFGSSGGEEPTAGLVQGTDGNLYGTTSTAENTGEGTIFEITTGGTLTTLYSFTDVTNGFYPFGGLVQHTNGDFYGVTDGGGSNGAGVVYSLSMGLGPFVKLLPTSGKVGSTVHILGTNLTDVTSVTFNGKTATFKPGTSTSFTATVPTGATTGTVKVVYSGGTLVSNVPFTVP
jgi:uncharacterized repeat protein (TIGR03803 family)